MEISWLGHSSFLIRDSKGRTLLTDPFDNTVGYEPFSGNVDVITISHSHFDHNYTQNNTGNAKILDRVGFFNLCDIPITGMPSYHDTIKGAKRGDNIIFIFEMDGYKLCHLGDLGHPLTKEEIDLIGNIDVLFIPVGGNYTINGKEASEIAHNIRSHYVIPMHYKTSAISFPLEGVENFLIHMKSGDKVESSTLKIEEPLKEYNIVKVLKFHSKDEK